ncbi:MAG TPA: hypothetical protein VFS61_05070 [Anaerolineales bacterium]|nr:hypothetical protein [Anaerolineales bacterium]
MASLTGLPLHGVRNRIVRRAANAHLRFATTCKGGRCLRMGAGPIKQGVSISCIRCG